MACDRRQSTGAAGKEGKEGGLLLQLTIIISHFTNTQLFKNSPR